MIIKFLQNCTAPQLHSKVYCECCGPELEWEDTEFFIGEECEVSADPDFNYGFDNINLKSLTYKVDYEILVYP